MTTDGRVIPAIELAQLREEVELLRAERQQFLEQLQQKSREIDGLQHQLQQLLRRLFGRSAEKIDPKQMLLFETLLNQLAPPTPTVEAPPESAPTPKPSNQPHGRRRLPSDLPRKKVIHDLPEDQKPCPCCRTMRHVIGQEISEQLDYVPAKLTVRRLRQEKSVPRLAQFKAWLKSQQAARGGPVLPKSPVGQAITYALNQWDALGVYTTNGDLAIDNNAAENALRRVAIGRKNWLFCGSDNGGNTAAVHFSLIATCQRHRVDPFAYLRDVLTRIAATPINELDQFLPDRWSTAIGSLAI